MINYHSNSMNILYYNEFYAKLKSNKLADMYTKLLCMNILLDKLNIMGEEEYKWVKDILY